MVTWIDVCIVHFIILLCNDDFSVVNYKQVYAIHFQFNQARTFSPAGLADERIVIHDYIDAFVTTINAWYLTYTM